MASLDGNSIKQEGSITTSEGFVLLVWTALLSGDSTDTFTVPGATSTAGVSILLKGLGEAPEMPFTMATDSRNQAQASITVGITATSGGNSTVTVTNSASPRRRNSVIIVTKHRAGMSNSLSIDESV